MTEVVLFHHALGLTDGLRLVAEVLRAGGHVVHLPDLYDGKVFGTLEEGLAHAEALGPDEVVRRGVAAADALPDEVVHAGFSLGVLPAQRLAQTRPGSRGALLFHGAVPLEVFGTRWPSRVPLQMHITEGDEDIDVCRTLAAEADDAELFQYPGSKHLFSDPSAGDYDPVAARVLLDRTLEFLGRVAG